MDDNNRKDSINTEDENITMGELLAKSEISSLKEGETITGTFVRKTPDGYLFDIGRKFEALVLLSENLPEERLSGLIKLAVIKTHDANHDGMPLLSYRRVVQKESKQVLFEAYRNKMPVSGKVTESVKGGYKVDLGIEAFLPLKHAVTKKDELLGQKINFIITEFKEDSMILSERVYRDMLKDKAITDFFRKYAVGDVIEGSVSSMTSFGAFIDICGAEGLLHLSDISWGEVKSAKDVLKQGQKLKVKILAVNETQKKISLGLKQLTTDPWSLVDEKYKIGDIVKVKVKNSTEFGLFCEVEDGIDGLIHISEIDWLNSKPDLKNIFKQGETIRAKIIAKDSSKNKISLSTKRLKPSPWDELSDKISTGSKLMGTVEKLLPFGAVIKIAEGVSGILHIKNIDWLGSVKNITSVYKLGQTIEVYVLEFNPKEFKLELSVKHLKENPFEKYKVKTVVVGVVKKIINAGVIIELDNSIEAFVPKNELSKNKFDDINEVIKLGEMVSAVIILSDSKRKKFEVSIKKYEIQQDKKLFAKYSSERPGPKLGEMLEEL